MNFADAVALVNSKLAHRSAPDLANDDMFKDLGKEASLKVLAEFARSEEFVPASEDRIKIASIDDLFAFERIGSNTLIHTSSKELWAVETDDDGHAVIAKLFHNASGEPLKG